MRGIFSYGLLFLLSLVTLGARAQMVGGTISGEVVDPGGAALSRAEVVIRNDETGSERKFVTAESGTFSAPSVSVGVYSVVFPMTAFLPLPAPASRSRWARMCIFTWRSPWAACNKVLRSWIHRQWWTLLLCRPRAWWMAAGKGASTERPQLRPANPVQSRVGELHHTAVRRRRNIQLLGREYVFGLGTASPGQSLSSERH